jgi:shikimate dehydrogenase
MGPVGHFSRILGALEGNALTFAASPETGPTAPGQPTLRDLAGRYRLRALGDRPAVFGVVGAAADSSLSPALHNHALGVLGVDAVYLPLPAPDPAPVFDWLRQGRLTGLSVTAPFKTAAAAAADHRSREVEFLGAANTLLREAGGALRAENTDVPAARSILGAAGAAGRRLAVLGAGGAAAAVLRAAGSLGASVTVFNRTPERAARLARRLGALSGAWDAFDPAAFDLVVNAAHGNPEGLVDGPGWRNTVLVDLTYGPEPTRFETLAARHGLVLHDGRAFLVEQAVEQFFRFTGLRAEPTLLRAGLSA